MRSKDHCPACWVEGTPTAYSVNKCTEWRCPKCKMEWDINEDFKCGSCSKELPGRFLYCDNKCMKEIDGKV